MFNLKTAIILLCLLVAAAGPSFGKLFFLSHGAQGPLPPLSIASTSISCGSGCAYSSGATTGTAIGNASATLSFGTFAGSWSTSGTAGADFTFSGNSLQTNGSTPTCTSTTTLNLNIVATQSGATNSPFPQAITVACNPSGGGGGAPTAPTQASVASLTTCIVCIDFTAASGGVFVNGVAPVGVNANNPSTWLDCAGASTVIFLQGQNDGPPSKDVGGPCPTIVNDGNGNPRVLSVSLPTNAGAPGTGDPPGHQLNGLVSAYNGAGNQISTSFYGEMVYWISAWAQPNASLDGWWVGNTGSNGTGPGNDLEFDGFEIDDTNTSGEMSSVTHNWTNGANNGGFPANWFGTYPPGYTGFDPTSCSSTPPGATCVAPGYHKVGMRITTDGTSALYKCMWIDGLFINCAHNAVDGSNLLAFQVTDAHSRSNAFMGIENHTNPTVGPVVMLVKSWNLWGCTNWKTTACSTPGNPDPGGY